MSSTSICSLPPNIPKLLHRIDTAQQELTKARGELEEALHCDPITPLLPSMPSHWTTLENLLRRAEDHLATIRRTVVSPYFKSDEASSRNLLSLLQTVSDQVERAIKELAANKALATEHLENALKELDGVRAALVEEKAKNESLGKNLREVQNELAAARREIVAKNVEVKKLNELIEEYRRNGGEGSGIALLQRKIREQEVTIRELEMEKSRLALSEREARDQLERERRIVDDLKHTNLDYEAR